METATKSSNLNRAIYAVFAPASIVSLNFLDPINWPKQIALITLLPLSLLNLSRVGALKINIKQRQTQLIAASALIFVLSALVNYQSIARLLWGSWGRNNGLITLLSLCVVLFIFSFVSRVQNSENSILRALSLVFIPASVYGMVQSFSVDPINWSAKGQVFSFFGNPNFASSILAVSAIASSYSAWISKTRFYRLIFTIQTLISLIVVWNTKSIQGFVLILGIGSVTCVFYFTDRFRISRSLVLGSIFFLAAITFAGFLGKGPLGNLLFQYTMKLREFYWSTGIKMGLSNPIFGVGIDSYGDNYRLFRTLQIAQTTSVDLTVDNAHNSIIQIFATLGGFGLLAYSLILFPALISVFKILLKKNPSSGEQGLSLLFVGTLLISLISIDNIAVAIIHWSLLGFYFGRFFIRSDSTNEMNAKSTSKNKNNLNTSKEAQAVIVTWISCLFLFAFSWISSSGDREIVRIFNTPAVSSDRVSIDERWKTLYSLSNRNELLQEAQYRYIVDGIQATDTWNIALSSSQKALVKYPKDFLLLDRAAVLSEKLGNFELAESYRARQLKLDPRHSLVWLYYARAQYEQGKKSAALASIDQAQKFRILLDANGLAYLNTLMSKLS